MNEVPPLSPPAWKDRRTGLIVFGVGEILLGCLCLVTIGFVALGQVFSARTVGTAFEPRMMVPILLFYLATAVLFFWLGTGSILCRKWARALTLVLAWPWLVLGVISVPITVITMRQVFAAGLPQGQAIPPGMLKFILAIQIVFLSLFFIALPAALILFYGSLNVKATCEVRDPVRRWTDGVPLPVLGVTVITFFGGVLMPFYSFAFHGVMPVFGTILSGIPGILVSTAIAALWIWIAVLWYKRKILGWWLLLGMILLFGISGVFTFSRIDIIDLYRKMGYPEPQIDLIRQYGVMTSSRVTWMMAIWIPFLLGYLVWAKRFFPRSQTGSTQSPGT
jgi:hypothetical protein